MANKHLVLISDLGHTGPIWPQILDGVASTGWRITILTPRMSFAQKRFFGLNYSSKKWKLVETSGFPSPYRKYAGYPKIVRTPFQLFSNFFFSKELKNQDNFDGYLHWKDKALCELNRIYVDTPFELLISTSSPFMTHIIAKDFVENHNVKWIADYRDLWSLNHASLSVNQKQVEYEKDILAKATACSTTSDGFKESLSQIFKGEIVTIHNGYDTLYPQKIQRPKSSILILYPGQIYKNLQDIRLLLRAIEIFNSQRNSLKVTLFISGYAIAHVKEVLQEIGFIKKDWVKFGAVLPLKESLKLQRDADLLLLLNCTNPKVEGWMQTKLYEYISSGVTIIAVGGGNDESSRLISETNTGIILRSEREIVDFLNRYSSKDFIYPLWNLPQIKKLSRFQQGIELSKFIQNII